MKESDLKELLAVKGEPCISVILSTELKSFDDKEKIQLQFKKTLIEVDMLLNEKFKASVVKELMNPIKDIVRKIDLRTVQKGVGIFVKEGFSRLVEFPFPVTERITINDSFQLREILVNLDKMIPYRVLVLTKNDTRGFKGRGLALEEFIDDTFPKKYEEEFQFQPASPYASHREQHANVVDRKAAAHAGTSHERSKIEQARLEEFFRNLDQQLSGYINIEPVVLLGVESYLSTFKNCTRYKNQIAGEIHGSHNRLALSEIESMVWPVMEQYQKKALQKMQKTAETAVFERKAVSGIQEVWDIAQKGVGDSLFVERDYRCRAYTNSFNEIVLKASEEDGYIEIPDAVEAIIDTTLQKSGNVHFVENDSLKDYDRIILTTRY